MTDKIIKNEQWFVKQIISKIKNNEIHKPKYQRKRKWDKKPKKTNSPNDYDYIKFLYDTMNSVHAITFGQETDGQRIFFSNIDGNNRLNAIKNFMDKPFEIFDEYLTDLNKFIDSIQFNKSIDSSEEESDYRVNDKIKNIFKELSYNELMNFKYNKYFVENGYKKIYDSKLKIYRDDFEPYIEKIQENLKVNGTDNFDSCVIINVNLFEGYNTDELCKTFEDINKYNSKLTETELLACRLHNICNFTITNKPFETELYDSIKEYYKDKSNQEVLNCFTFNTNDKISAHDFIVGYQNMCNKQYKFIDTTCADGLSLFFKLWKALYCSFKDTFTTENVNDFVEKIYYCCNILKETISDIFTNKINDKLFNSSCQDKLSTLKKNNILMVFSSIIGFKNINEERNKIKKNIEKCLIFHFFISDITNKDQREAFKNYDSISYRAGSGFIESSVKANFNKPERLSKNITSELFEKIIKLLVSENKVPYIRKLENGNNKNDKRRPLKFFEKTEMFYYYKNKIPTNMLDNDFSIEHIMPNSSEWDNELNKDRIGNLIPIISRINCQRGNKHINTYKKQDEGREFCDYINDIIPSDEQYNSIIEHSEGRKAPKIIDNEKYNDMCEKNEKIYMDNLIKCLFKY